MIYIYTHILYGYMYTYVVCIHMLYVYICHHHIYVHSFVCAKCNIYIYDIYIYTYVLCIHMFYVYIYMYTCIYIYIHTFVHVDLETKPSHLFVFDATHTQCFSSTLKKRAVFSVCFFAQDIFFNRAHVDVLICFDFILLINVVSPINLNPNHHTFL